MFTIVYYNNEKKSSQRFKWYEHRRKFKYAKIRTRHQVKLYVYFVVFFVLADT